MTFRPFNEESKYKFEIRTRSNYEVKIILQIDNSNVNKIMEYRGFEKFSEKKIQALLDCYLKEVFLYSNFEKFNNQKDLEFYSEPIKTDGHIFTINSGVRNKKEKALKIKQI